MQRATHIAVIIASILHQKQYLRNDYTVIENIKIGIVITLNISFNKFFSTLVLLNKLEHMTWLSQNDLDSIL